MPFIGKQPTAGFASIVKDDFTADGSTTAFTLSKQVANANDIAVFVGNVRQEPTDAYTVNGTTLTMSAAPASGINFYVLHIAGTIESSVVPADGTITTAKMAPGALSFDALSDTTVTTSDPSATSNKTPVGHIWVNSTSGEAYVLTDATTGANVWKNIGDGSSIYDITDVLIVAGGGGGGARGGGGAGGYIQSSSLSVMEGDVITATVGLGGSQGGTGDGGDGGDSSLSSGAARFSTLTAIGGGGGGSNAGRDGGSGGGGDYPSQAGGSGTVGQGFDGGIGRATSTVTGGGGGGASSQGGDGGSSNGGDGGNGITDSITGSSVVYAGGGGGGSETIPGGSGGTGGGGAGAFNANSNGVDGTDGLGGGGGGSYNATWIGGDGGDGVVIIRVPTINYTGTTTGSPTVTTDGADTIIKFTQSGTYTG